MYRLYRVGRVVMMYAWAAFAVALAYQTMTLPNKLLQAANAATRAVVALPDSVVPKVLATVNNQADSLRTTLDARLGILEKDTTVTVNRTLDVMDKRLGESLDQVGRAVDTVQSVQKDLQPTIKALEETTQQVAVITKHVSDALPPFTDCAYEDANGDVVGGNPDCLFNRYQGASKSFERAMNSVEKGMKLFPDFVATGQKSNENVAGMTKELHGVFEDVHKLTTEWSKPRTIKQQIMDWVKLGGLVGARFL